MVVKVWLFGDDREVIEHHCDKYIKKRWKRTTKECAIYVDAREMDEGTGFLIIAYTSDPSTVGTLASQLFQVANEGNTKVYWVELELFDEIYSQRRKYVDSMETVERLYKKWIKALLEVIKDDDRIKAESEKMRKITTVVDTELLCELSSKRANKIILDLVGINLSNDKILAKTLTEALVKRGIANKVTRYKLVDDTEGYKIYDIDITDDEIYLELAR